MIRIPSLNDLSDPGQVAQLMRVLQEIRNELSRTAMPVEQRRTKTETIDERRFRVVSSERVPGDPEFNTQEVHFNIGGKWKRVMLEEI